MLRLKDNIHRILFSSPSHFFGEYEDNNYLISHAFPLNNNAVMQQNMFKENTYSRYYYILSFKSDNYKKQPHAGSMLPDFSYFGDIFCIILSILYGKRFDNLGFLESHGLFHLPNFSNISPTSFKRIGPFNDKPRNDLKIELNFTHFALINKIFHKNRNRSFRNILFKAGRFYLRSLQMLDIDPDLAYLNLINCGEILSNYYKYPDNELFDSDILDVFKLLKDNIPNSKSSIKILKSRLYQVKKRYTLTICKMLNPYFYNNYECDHINMAIKATDVETRIKSTYDLRSLFLHTGLNFTEHLNPILNYITEIPIGRPVMNDRKVEKLIANCLTYNGLERVMRFCLLRFIHLNSFFIDKNLDD